MNREQMNVEHRTFNIEHRIWNKKNNFKRTEIAIQISTFVPFI